MCLAELSWLGRVGLDGYGELGWVGVGGVGFGWVGLGFVGLGCFKLS